MDKDDIINEMYDFGFQHTEGYLTNDICFDFDGCGGYPLAFPNWENAEAFLNVLKNIRGEED